MPLTAISTHNGKISNEVRLIFVTEQETGLPVYMRYVSGAIRDVSTISATIKELKAQGIDPEAVLMDAGYYSDRNIRLLHKAGIHFICRLKENMKLFKELVSSHKNDLESKENLVKFGRRLVFIKCEKVPLVAGVPGYAYVCMDVDRRADETRRMLDHLDPKAELEEDTFEALESGGNIHSCFDRKDRKRKNTAHVLYTPGNRANIRYFKELRRTASAEDPER